VESGERIFVGVNRFTEGDEPAMRPPDTVDPDLAIARLAAWRGQRDQATVDRALADVETAARGTENMMGPLGAALRQGATVGEVSDAMRRVFGTWDPAGG